MRVPVLMLLKKVEMIVSDRVACSSSRKLKFVIFTKASQRRQQLHFNHKHVTTVQWSSALDTDRSEQTKQSADDVYLRPDARTGARDTNTHSPVIQAFTAVGFCAVTT